MTADQANKLTALRRAFGKVVPPDKITQEAFGETITICVGS
jgi:hypothetical protein